MASRKGSKCPCTNNPSFHPLLRWEIYFQDFVGHNVPPDVKQHLKEKPVFLKRNCMSRREYLKDNFGCPHEWEDKVYCPEPAAGDGPRKNGVIFYNFNCLQRARLVQKKVALQKRYKFHALQAKWAIKNVEDEPEC